MGNAVETISGNYHDMCYVFVVNYTFGFETSYLVWLLKTTYTSIIVANHNDVEKEIDIAREIWCCTVCMLNWTTLLWPQDRCYAVKIMVGVRHTYPPLRRIKNHNESLYTIYIIPLPWLNLIIYIYQLDKVYFVDTLTIFC